MEAVVAYLKLTTNVEVPGRPLFLQMKNGGAGFADAKGLSGHGLYKDVIKKYFSQIGVSGLNFGAHVLRVTAATNALENGADINKVRRWMGHSNISTTQLYDRRGQKPEESPTFILKYH
jgi:site-specific recombinase XerD